MTMQRVNPLGTTPPNRQNNATQIVRYTKTGLYLGTKPLYIAGLVTLKQLISGAF